MISSPAEKIPERPSKMTPLMESLLLKLSKLSVNEDTSSGLIALTGGRSIEMITDISINISFNHYSNAGIPVISLPRISVCIS